MNDDAPTHTVVRRGGMRAVALMSAMAAMALLATDMAMPHGAVSYGLSSSEPRRTPAVDGAPVAYGGRSQVRFWHVTDAHLNLWHDRTGDVRDMCRSRSSDVHMQPGRFGHFNCDPSVGVTSVFLAKMARTEPAPDFILFGGDSFGHVPAAHDNGEGLRMSHRAVARAIREHFPHTIVVPTLGNHDTMPYFTAGDAAAEALSEMATLYSEGLGQRQRRQLSTRGYYVHKLGRAQLWLVVLETNALSLPAHASAAAAQLEWLGEVLDSAAAARASVVILGHIAPGASHIDWDSMAAAGWAGGGWTGPSQRTFYRLVRRDRGRAISAMLFGHLHTSSVRLLRPTPRGSDDGTVGGTEPAGRSSGTPAELPVMYLGPSLTPRNPTPHRGGVRLYTVDVSARRAGAREAGGHSVARVVDVVDHTFDLDASNAASRPVWHAESLQAAHNLSSLTHSAWSAWARSLHDDRAFVRHMSAQRCADEVEADYARCKASVLCALTELEESGYATCLADVRAHAIQPPGWVLATKRAV